MAVAVTACYVTRTAGEQNSAYHRIKTPPARTGPRHWHNREPKRARPLFGRQKVTSLSEELRAVPDTQLLHRMFLIKLGSVRPNRLASDLMD